MKMNTLIKKISNAMTFGLVFGASLCSAPALSSPYSVSLSLGQASTDLNQSHADIVSSDDSDTSMGIELGYELEFLTLTLGYIDLGEASVKLAGESYSPSDYHQQVKAVAPRLVSGFTLGAEKALYTQDSWSINGQLGVLIWDNELKSQLNSEVLTTKEDGTDVYLGGMGEYQLSPQWSVSAQYRAYLLSETIQDISVKVSYQF